MREISFGLASSLLSRGTALLKSIRQSDASNSVLRSDTHVLIIHGELDTLTRVSGSQRLADAIHHHVQLYVVPAAKHEVHCELGQNGRHVYFERAADFATRAFVTVGR